MSAESNISCTDSDESIDYTVYPLGKNSNIYTNFNNENFPDLFIQSKGHGFYTGSPSGVNYIFGIIMGRN